MVANLIYRDTKNNRTIIQLSSGSNSWGIRTARNFIQGKPLDITQTILIKNVQLIDGTGIPSRNASVRIEGKRIKEVGILTALEGEIVIDGEEFAQVLLNTVCNGSLSEYRLAALAGITTIVAGQDGSEMQLMFKGQSQQKYYSECSHIYRPCFHQEK
jgi:hypothetical protein